MGVDVNKVKQKAEEEAARAAARQSGGFKYWSPAVGKNNVRFMPPWTTNGDNANQFWREIFVHWGIGADDAGEGGQSFACPSQTPFGPGGACPVCQYVAQLRATKDQADMEMANNLRAKQRFYSNVVDLEDAVYTSKDVEEWKGRQEDKTRECPFKVGDTKVQVFSYGPMIYKDLLDLFSEADLSDLNAGRTIVITKEGQGRETKYRTRPEFSPTSFSPKGRPLADVLVDLDRLMPFAPPEQMSAALNGEAYTPPARQVGSGKQAPQLPPANAAPTPTPAPKAAAPAQKVQQPKPTPAVLPQAPAEPEGEAPPCFKDLTTCSKTDAECVGGQKGQDIYDPCPFFKQCDAAMEASKAPAAPPARRAAKKAPAAPAQASEVDDLEAEMRQSLEQ